MNQEKKVIYLDNNATTAIDPEVRAVMLPFWESQYANPSSPYSMARPVSRALSRARDRVGTLLDLPSRRIFFTSGGTESNNTAIHAALKTCPDKRHIITTKTEHVSALNFCNYLIINGYRITYIHVDAAGTLDVAALEQALDRDTALVSIMAANNETGICYPIEACARLAKKKGALFHSDAVQAVGKIDVAVQADAIDFLSFSGHKIHGPKGAGGFYAREGIPPAPYLIGGDQELGWRGGTENVAGIAGLGKAAELALRHKPFLNDVVTSYRDRLEKNIKEQLSDIIIVGAETERLPNTSLAIFKGVEAEAILAALDMAGICCSSGSACASGSSEPSHVLTAMGYAKEEVNAAVRFSFSRLNRVEEVDVVTERVVSVVERLRKS